MIDRRGSQHDYVIAGGGLQGCLLAYAIATLRPTSKTLLIERDSIGGNHTWSFHRSDISPTAWTWLQSVIDCQWDHYDVHVGGFSRNVPLGYGCIRSHCLADRLHKIADCSDDLQIEQATIAAVEPTRVILEGGRAIEARVAFDCRGLPRGTQPLRGCGFQKFFGLEVELEEDWTSTVPCVMDDRLDQTDGFRFMYSLPFARRRLLVEDTRFSNFQHFDATACRKEIERYLRVRGFERYRVLREEAGCLPMPYAPTVKTEDHVLGYRGGFFHPATGYSMPLAVDLADQLARAPTQDTAKTVRDFRERHRFQQTFSRWLNRMLFQLVRPETRFTIFRRFYERLPLPTIERFYAHQFTMNDAARMLIGKPPSGLSPLRFARSLWGEPCPAH